MTQEKLDALIRAGGLVIMLIMLVTLENIKPRHCARFFIAYCAAPLCAVFLCLYVAHAGKRYKPRTMRTTPRRYGDSITQSMRIPRRAQRRYALQR